jgi:excisionase family DNA binding protein
MSSEGKTMENPQVQRTKTTELMPKTSNLESPLLTTSEACRYLKIGRTSLYCLVKRGELAQVHPLEGRSAYLKDDLDAFILARRSA